MLSMTPYFPKISLRVVYFKYVLLDELEYSLVRARSLYTESQDRIFVYGLVDRNKYFSLH